MNPLLNINSFIAEKVTNRKDSLLRPDLTQYHDQLTAAVQGKSVLVIGGAGTIGSSYIKAILRYKPGKLVVVDINENGLTELVRDCRSHSELELPEDFKSYPINMDDKVFRKIFIHEGPFHIVANFAAHKHVRSEKDIYSIEAMLDNNVFKAKKLLDLLLEFPPEHFFCVSTDKAANPVNMMGASKKLMEEVILAYSDRFKITTARFANVAFSNGSLLAGFIERIMKKQPLVSPSDVDRYFVSPAESGEICLLACLMAESGDVVFPKLSHEKDLTSLARISQDFIRFIGYDVQICHNESDAKQAAANLNEDTVAYPLYLFNSGTSGEKLYEEFYTEQEILDNKKFRSLGVIKNAARRDIGELNTIIEDLKLLFDKNISKQDIVKRMNELLPTFNHIEKGKNLDQHM